MYREIPVDLYTGFLGAGKTQYIKNMLCRDYSQNTGPVLLLICEEGEQEYDDAILNKKNVFTEYLTEPSELREARLHALAEKYAVRKIIIEYNGMWNTDLLFYCLPPDCTVYNEILIAEAETFVSFNTNMRQQTYWKLKTCDQVIFNRFLDPDTLMDLHRIVRAANAKCGILYEKPDGNTITDTIIDPPPFTTDGDTILISDSDYAKWLRDLGEHTDSYAGRRVRVKGVCSGADGSRSGYFRISRRVMTCCEADMEDIPVLCRTDDTIPDFSTWLLILGTIHTENVTPGYGSSGMFIEVDFLEECDPPANIICTFY